MPTRFKRNTLSPHWQTTRTRHNNMNKLACTICLHKWMSFFWMQLHSIALIHPVLPQHEKALLLSYPSFLLYIHASISYATKQRLVVKNFNAFILSIRRLAVHSTVVSKYCCSATMYPSPTFDYEPPNPMPTKHHYTFLHSTSWHWISWAFQ